MKFLEKDLEQIIYEHTNTKDFDYFDKLLARGLEIVFPTKSYRQLKIGNYGVADIVNYTKPQYIDGVFEHDRHHTVDIIELKKEKISLSTFMQAVKYAKGIKRYFNDYKKLNVDINIILIGKEVPIDTDFVFLPDLINSCNFKLDVYKYEYRFEGIYFKNISGYKLTNEGFKL